MFSGRNVESEVWRFDSCLIEPCFSYSLFGFQLFRLEKVVFFNVMKWVKDGGFVEIVGFFLMVEMRMEQLR